MAQLTKGLSRPFKAACRQAKQLTVTEEKQKNIGWGWRGEGGGGIAGNAKWKEDAGQEQQEYGSVMKPRPQSPNTSQRGASLLRNGLFPSSKTVPRVMSPSAASR